jgi:hypothetical protein
MANFCSLPDGERISEINLANSQDKGSPTVTVGLWGYIDMMTKQELQVAAQPYLKAQKGDIQMTPKGQVRLYQLSSSNAGRWTVAASPVGDGPTWDTLTVNVRRHTNCPGTFPDDVITAAQAAHDAWNIPASITLAQWAVESNWGTQMPSGSNNPFGIKAGAGQRFVMALTREVVNGESVMIRAPFRAFDSIEEAFDEHGRLLATHPAYAEARAHASNPDAFADALTGRYATDPTYGATLKARMKLCDLYQFD